MTGDRRECKNAGELSCLLISMESRSASVLFSRLMARARLRHLQLFVKLSELGNIKRSAEALHMSQPAATQLLADLERLAEMALFDRHARGVRITAAGQALVPAARRVLEAMADASESLNAIQRQSEGVVRIAAITGAISGWLVRALPALAQAHPTIQVQVQECDADRCSELVARREVDVSLCREPVALPTGCAFHPQLADDFVVACGLAHPLAQRKRVSWSMLARERWLLPPVLSAARRAFDERMAAIGAEPPTSAVVTRVSALTWAMLKQDRLLTLVPHGVVRQLVEAGELALVETPAPMPFSPLGWLLPEANVSEATQRVIDHLAAFARPPS